MNEQEFRGLVPPLSKEQYAALKADIRDNGLTTAILRDENAKIVDGFSRDQACIELGIPNVPYLTRSGLTDDQKIALRLSLNFKRRHLSKKQLKKVAATLRGRGWTQESIAANLDGIIVRADGTPAADGIVEDAVNVNLDATQGHLGREGRTDVHRSRGHHRGFLAKLHDDRLTLEVVARGSQAVRDPLHTRLLRRSASGQGR